MDCSCALLPMIGRFKIRGAVRLQKYVYLLSRKSYDDWTRTRHYHYSKKLTRDLQDCMMNGLVSRTPSDDMPLYVLTRKGKDLLKGMQAAGTGHEIEQLQKLDLETLLCMTAC